MSSDPSLLATLAAGSLVLVSSVDQVPTLNTAPTCAGAAVLSLDSTVAACERDEQDARATLRSEWTKFRAADRRDCVETTQIGGMPSYVQVLTCLEIARDARNMPTD